MVPRAACLKVLLISKAQTMRTVLRRWYFLVAAVLVAAGIGIGAMFVYMGQGRITQANFNRITEGMSAAEVCEILGTDMVRPGWIQGGNLYVWTDGPSRICVAIYPECGVTYKDFEAGTLWERVKYTVGRWLPKI